MINRKRIKPAAEETEVNVTPLLDIVFIMLIFFIVTATFVYEDGFSPNLPEPSPDEPTNPPPALLLFVQEDGFVLVDDVRIIDPRSVKPVVEEFLASKPRGVIQITAALESESGVTVTVLDQARQANINAPIVVAKAAE
ncbi:MAG: biopolymer transporter ExbD [Aquisalinus sp.]|nr:biopolymer transporter ExbD [Aquisalinus sp.]